MITDKLPYLNVGCGYHYHKDWTNIDFISTGEGVQAYNLINGIPYGNESFKVVYHSHVLEHFSKAVGRKFIKECFRVLKKNGILRIAIPDLQMIINEYQSIISQLENNPDDKYLNACYDWILIELFDQMIRNHSGGMMSAYLSQKEIINEDYVLKRCGYEVKGIIDYYRKANANDSASYTSYKATESVFKKMLIYIKSIPDKVKSKLIKKPLPNEQKFYEIGKFRSEGEIHQWMYDKHSLSRLLKETGFQKVNVCKNFESSIPGWKSFRLENIHDDIRKPDSLFIEAIK